MLQASLGKNPKRDPITIQQPVDGVHAIIDGNGTYTAAKNMGWHALPAVIEA